MSEDIRFCSLCGGYTEAGGDSTCTCPYDPDEEGDYRYHERKDNELDSPHAHELINRRGL